MGFAGPLSLAVALAFEDDLVGVVGEAVDGALSEDGIVEEWDPLVDGSVGRQASLTPGAMSLEDDLVEVAGLLGVEAAQGEVIDDEDVGREQTAEDLLGGVIGARLVRDRDSARKGWLLQCGFALAATRAAAGQLDAAREAIDTIAIHLLERGHLDFELEARAFEVELALRAGHVSEAISWGRQARFGGLYPFPYFHHAGFTLAKVHLAEETPASRDAALEVVRRLREWTTATNDQRRLADAIALEAVVLDARSDERGAFESLSEALALTARGSALRPFLDLGEPMLGLLSRAPVMRATRDHVERILAAAGSAERSGDRPSGVVHELTNRELDILELLADRLRDKEIAARLVISPATVKSHLKGLYPKLDVGDRRSAVERARDLRVLPGA